MAEKGSVLIVGGGVGGIQAALDLAESGMRAYILESGPSIGGVMAQLDKTFPTNDCSMCILSPKLVEAGQHPNIEIISYADLDSIEGSPGDFKVNYTQKPRYIDTVACTGCGACSEVCVLADRIPDEFNAGLSMRSACYVPFAQAVPRVALIDPARCLRLTKGKCKSPCLEACQAKAVDFDMAERKATLEVGAIILASGARPRDIEDLTAYHPDHPNVVSSIEIERIMCASGPSGGSVVRPSDSKHASRIAFIQCAGSRDEKFNPYCSSVCCTYAIKEATVIKEHDPDIDCHIFHIDMRTFGKGFENFRTRAAEEYGIKFTRFKVPAVDVVDQNTLGLRYLDSHGKWQHEEFDIVVLSVGLNPEPPAALQGTGVDIDEYGFVQTRTASPLDTSVEGIFSCGSAGGPKDIPETVAQASGAAARAGALLAASRGTQVSTKEYPPEIELDGSEPRVGVFVCSCGKNIGGVVDVESVKEYAEGLPCVSYAETNMYTCSGESCDRIKQAIKDHDLNRVVVAACTPRTHEPLFRETIREAGLNRYLFDLANIRDQCSWVHSGEPEKATAKAKDLVRMSIARARLLEPLPQMPVKVTPAALVIGGGPAGMAAALEMGRAGYQTYLVEREKQLGGGLRDLPQGAGEEVKALMADLEAMKRELEELVPVEVITEARLVGFSGYVGNFKAVLEASGKNREIDAGAVVLATGGKEHVPTSYLYGKSDKVVTQMGLEARFDEAFAASSVVMIQCVEAREPGREYCSRVCCTAALNNALAIKAASPGTDVYILYRDIMAYGLSEERLYRAAREAGVKFIRFEVGDKPDVTESGGGLLVKVRTPDLPVELEIPADLLVLSAPVVADESAVELAEMLKVPLDEDNFFLEAHVKLRPVDFATAGIFLAGMCHYPKLVDEAISQGAAAAGRAATILSKEYIMGEGAVAIVEPRMCRGCGECEETCEFSAVKVTETDDGRLVAAVNEALCVGCGMCAVACWSNAITMKNFTDQQIEAMIDAVRPEAPARKAPARKQKV